MNVLYMERDKKRWCQLRKKVHTNKKVRCTSVTKAKS